MILSGKCHERNRQKTAGYDFQTKPTKAKGGNSI
jgi:hypothetical protein